MNSDTIRAHAGHIGVILLCLWCIASGLIGTFHLTNPTINDLLPIVLLLAGVLMLIGK